MEACEHAHLATIHFINGHSWNQSKTLHFNAPAVDDFARRHHVLKHKASLLALVEGDGVHLALDLDKAGRIE